MALGKHKSFVSQITNPAYTVPIPAGDLPTIFEICHLSAQERAGFLALYRQRPPRAPGAWRRPGRAATSCASPCRSFAPTATAREVEALILDFAARIIRLAQHAEAAHDQGGKPMKKLINSRRHVLTRR